MRLMLIAIACFVAGCDSSPERDVLPLGPTAATLDWDQVRLHTGGQERELFWGLLRELDMRTEADSGELVLFWGTGDAIVSGNGTIVIERFWPRDAEEPERVTPRLWKSLVAFVGQNSSGGYQGSGLRSIAFRDGRGEASDTDWTLTPAEGPEGEPVLLVEWKTKWSPTLPGDEPGGP